MTYVPAAGRDWLLPLYDPLTALLGVKRFHARLIHQAAIAPDSRVLEIGCGTGNLSLLAKRLCPAAEVTGTDPDPKALARARRKAERAGLSVRFDLAYAEALLFPDASFDRVLSALMLHHLPAEVKIAALREVRRVLRPGGSLHLADFDGGHAHGLHDVLAKLIQSRRGSTYGPVVLDLMQDAGLVDGRMVASQASIMGRIVFCQARCPARAA
jgi:ubiquinone/menaquinone biosynthesis C-methylase UbiE